MYNFLLLLFLILSLFLWFRRKHISKIEWIAIILTLGLNLIFLILLFPLKKYFSYYLLLVPLISYIFMAVKTFLNIKKEPVKIKLNLIGYIVLAVCVISSIFLAYQYTIYFSGYSHEVAPVKLAFPFKDGTYLIFNGGNGQTSPLMNYHFTNKSFKQIGVNASMKYAIDITKLNALGSNRNSIFTNQNEDYPIFGENLYSPCSGEVVDVQNGFSDNIIGEKYQSLDTGNTIIIKTGDAYILLAHLKEGSISVKKGDKVEQGQLIAQVGNSGLSSGPHLHIQAMKGPSWGSKGLPIMFDGVNPVKNTLFIKGK